MLNISLLWSLQSSVTELKYAICLGQNLLALAILKFPYQEKAYSSTNTLQQPTNNRHSHNIRNGVQTTAAMSAR